MDTGLLESVGLTKSEAKVYLALLELGSSSKGPIVKRSGVASSKVYELLDKLIAKGLVSIVVKANVDVEVDDERHFNPFGVVSLIFQ